MFILFVVLVFALIFVSLSDVKNDYISFGIYLLSVFLILAFMILYLIGEKPKKEHLSNSDFYNRQDCAQDGTCIISPDENNLFPKDLTSLANKSFYQCKPVRPDINVCKSGQPCKNIVSGCNNKNMYPIITPNLPADILTKGQCAICKIPVDTNVEYFSNYSKDKKNICSHCQVGYCKNGLCFGIN